MPFCLSNDQCNCWISLHLYLLTNSNSTFVSLVSCQSICFWNFIRPLSCLTIIYYLDKDAIHLLCFWPSTIQTTYLLFLWWGRCVDKQIITQLQGKETGAREHGELIKGRVVPYREHWRTTADAKVLCPVWEKALHRSFQTKSSLYGNRSQFLKGHLRAVVLYEMAGGSRMLPLKTQSADSYSRPVSNWPFLFCSSALTDGNAVSWIHHLDHGNLSRNSCLGLAFVGTRNSFHV